MDPAGRSPAAAWGALAEPVDRRLLALLRRAVLDHATAEPRRVHPPVVHVGVPGAGPAVLPLGDQRLDHALRTDVLEAMLRRARATPDLRWAPLVWLTRSGSHEVRDVDLVWAAAARSAAAELGQAVPLVVVTRRSWHDPTSGVRREWTRVRPPLSHAQPRP